MNIVVCTGVSDEIDSESQDHYDYILVLGAGLRSDGTPSDMLHDRVARAVELYKQGRADRMIMSGDSQNADYDETGAMKKLAVELGVPEDKIDTDRYGVSTYDSMKRAKDVYGIDNMIVVTQKYHLYRALYIAKKQDIDIEGYSADPREYRNQTYRNIREFFARCKDVINCAFDAGTKYGEK